MNPAIDKVNDIFDKHQHRTNGSFHNTLWQLLVNCSLAGELAAFEWIASMPCIIIALESGGYISANFDAVDEADRGQLIDDLNADVFGLLPEGAWRIVARSMRKRGAA